MRHSLAVLLLFSASVVAADDVRTELGGHTKFRAVGMSFPDASLYRDIAGANALDLSAELRLNLELSTGRWTFDSSYQLLGLHGDSIRYGEDPPNDDHRLFNLSKVFAAKGDTAMLHRLDRLWVGYTSEKAVVRLGRQALSWGNGLVYAPMDLVNPFDPTAIDTEYKAGDDMLYLQYLQDNGNDVQAAYVARRDPATGEVESDQATAAVKYHGFAGSAEFDLLLARNFGDTVLGIGFGRPIGGAVWSSDLVVTNTVTDTEVQFVSNLMYSWMWQGRNMSGALEYYYDGFGEDSGHHYVAANVIIEMTPLWTVTPTLLVNAEDPSALVQLVTNYSLSDNMTLLGSLNVPLGANGTEFGGAETPVPGRYLSVTAGLFAQIAWYF